MLAALRIPWPYLILGWLRRLRWLWHRGSLALLPLRWAILLPAHHGAALARKSVVGARMMAAYRKPECQQANCQRNPCYLVAASTMMMLVIMIVLRFHVSLLCIGASDVMGVSYARTMKRL
jgi:hypothetical protein